jgi:hypothetical protein
VPVSKEVPETDFSPILQSAKGQIHPTHDRRIDESRAGNNAKCIKGMEEAANSDWPSAAGDRAGRQVV